MSNELDLSLQIADAVLPLRKRSERMVGFVQYKLTAERRLYKGVSQRPFNLSVRQKAIVYLISRGVSTLKDIAGIMGLDIADEVEKRLILSDISQLISHFELVDVSGKNYVLTRAGFNFIKTGVIVRTYTKNFEITVDPSYPSYTSLDELFNEHPAAEIGNDMRKSEDLTINQIQKIAEKQASHMQHESDGLMLLSADLIKVKQVKLKVYVCFLQSIRDGSVRTIVFDPSNNSIIKPLSLLFDENEGLKDSLLKKCLTNDVKLEEAEKVESPEKSKEQVEAEAKIIQEADQKGEEVSKDEIIRKEVGSIYDSAEFEVELHNIFEKHRNQEIWLISPWIKRHAFLRSREPMIRKFMDQGGAIFIGYSKPERLGEEMVDPESMSVVRRLDANYDNFYYAELPNFHNKDVIEYKDGKATLYTGSFNILSFSINKTQEHYRKENMTLANSKTAEEVRSKYLQQFASKYVQIFLDKIKKLGPGADLNVSKLNYLNSINAVDGIMDNIVLQATEQSISLYSESDNLSDDTLFRIANEVIQKKYQHVLYCAQAKLAAHLFLFEYFKKNDIKLGLANFENVLLPELLSNESMFEFCRVNMSPGKDNPKKTALRIVCNGFVFDFVEVSIKNNNFKFLQSRKERIEFRNENIQYARNCLSEILRNNAKAIGVVIPKK